MDPGPGVFDHELDSVPRRLEAPPRETIALYQRLAVNPVLAVLVFTIAAGTLSLALKVRSPRLFALAVGLYFMDLFLFQYHCFDCKATGWLLRYRRHVCPAVVARWHGAQLPRFCGPAVRIQLAAWLILLASLFVLGLTIFLAG
jgi:hypothetical protein